MDLEALMDELFRRAAAGDADGVASMCADGFRCSQNIGQSGGLDTPTALIAGLRDAGVRTTYSEVRRVVGERAVTEQHVVTLSGSDGVEAGSDVCVVVRFDDDGLVTQLDEHLDSAAFAAFLA